MLVIHPNDKHTSLAKAVYANLDVRLVGQEHYECGIGQLLWQTPKEESILMIGYGDSKGLYVHRHCHKQKIMPSETHDMSWTGIHEACMEVPQYAVRNLHAYSLRNHHDNIIGIWPGAAEFARRNKLHGLFTDCFVYNRKEAEHFGLVTLDMHIDEANLTLYRTLGKLINQHVPLSKIPDLLAEIIYEKPNMISVNYESFTWL